MTDRDNHPQYSLEARRKAARKTALLLALVAVGIFAAFILKGVLN